MASRFLYRYRCEKDARHEVTSPFPLKVCPAGRCGGSLRQYAGPRQKVA